jgi:hypothetical protein
VIVNRNQGMFEGEFGNSETRGFGLNMVLFGLVAGEEQGIFSQS